MRTLYICRHAKSSWADPGQDDFDRPLNERGLIDAPRMSKIFRERGEPVDLMVSSPAVRALTTARFFARELKLEDALVQEPRLFHATSTTINAIVNALPANAQRVMLFGHNPGFTEVLAHFTGEYVDNLPTCGLARIDFTLNEWELAGCDLGTLVWLDYPKRQPGA